MNNLESTWYRDAIIYQVHVRSFFDSDNDGVGDFRGLARKLDYIQDLGVTAIWILPFYPSPLRDDGYDIGEYTKVNPAYGTLRDFRAFMDEAHKRGLKVITELVINHTSDQHPWFQRARRAKPGSAARDFYVWSDTPQRYEDARIIFQDFEPSNWSWDPVAQAYYWHRFYSHQPDLNFENPRVHKAVMDAMDFWMELGVDGMRLDAIPYLYEREGTNCENLPETHEFLKSLRAHMDEKWQDRMLLAEANQWPEDSVAYFGDGDECHMSFHFPLMPRLFMAVRSENRHPIIDILDQTPAIPEGCQWAIFLRNHDELTLEMVTDEERDYMYRVYASDPQMRVNLGIRRRLSPLLGGNRRQIELMNALLFSLPGTPVMYYGDEIGMGDNIYLGDRNSVRTPMQWNANRNAGFSEANPHQLFLPAIIDPEYHYEFVNVEAQQANPSWLLWWMKRLIALRKQYHAFGRGSIEFLHPDNPRVLAYVRRYEDERILMVANLSRFSQAVELNLDEFDGATPIELFGHTQFPRVEAGRPFFLSLGPYSFHWFSLEPRPVTLEVRTNGDGIPVLAVPGAWQDALRGRAKAPLEHDLPLTLRSRRWFGGKARRVRSTSINDIIPLDRGSSAPCVALVRIDYYEGEPDTYALPLAFIGGEEAARVESDDPGLIYARIRSGDGEGLLVDATIDPAFRRKLISAFSGRRQFKGDHGTLAAVPTRAFRTLASGGLANAESRLLGAEQSNTSLVYGDRLILKLYRRVDEGVNPDLEIGRHLTEGVRFASTPQVAGHLEYRRERGQPATLAILQELVVNEGDAWSQTLDELGRYYERVLTMRHGTKPALPRTRIPDPEAQLPDHAWEIIGPYLESARLLGQRTGELHTALARGKEPAFAPEPFSELYQRSLHQSFRSDVTQAVQALRRALPSLDEPVREQAERVIASERALLGMLRRLTSAKLGGTRIRIHGDYHLGQVLWTGSDFVIIDFEGEPARPLSERRLKRSPMRDVAGMLRSFHYAAEAALVRPGAEGALRPADVEVVREWTAYWHEWVSQAFLQGYLASADKQLLPAGRDQLTLLLDAFLLQKAAYEMVYELNSRPDWAPIPLASLVELAAEAERNA